MNDRNQIYLPSNDTIQHTFKDFKNNQITSYNDYFQGGKMVNVTSIHNRINGKSAKILQIIFQGDYSNVFVKYHYSMDVLLNMNSLFKLLNHFHS